MAEKNANVWKVLQPLAILVFVAVVFWIGSQVRSRLGFEFSIESVRAWVDAWGVWAFIIYFVLVTFRIALLLPSLFILTVGGLCFGPVWGTLLGGGGVLLSAVLQFGFGRGVGRTWIRDHLGEKMPVLERRIESGGPLVIGLITAHPAVPMTSFHWASGFTSMRLVPFSVAVGLGALIRSFSMAFFGSTLVQIGSLEFYIATAVFAIVAIVPIVHPGLRRRIFQ